MKEILLNLVGKKLIRVILEKYCDIGLESVVFQLVSGQFYRIYTEEILLTDNNEVYTLCMENCIENFQNTTPVIEEDICNFHIGKIDLLKRDEWFEKVQPVEGIIGNNPRRQNWGKVGSSPSGIEEIVTVIAGIVLYAKESESNGQLMIYVSEYPGLVGFTMNNKDIARFHTLCTIQEF